MARIKVQITTPSNNVIKVSPGVSALSSVQLYLNELIDVNTEHGADGYVLTQQADGTFAMEAVATTLADLSDTNISNPSGGDSLVYDDASQKWVPGGVKSVNGQSGDVVITIPSPPPTPGVDGLADTNITNLQDNQIIRYDSNSGNWLNEDLEALPAGGTTGQALVKATGTDYDVEWADIAIDTQYHDRFQTDAETFRSGATATTELYYTAKADGDGLAQSASSDTPTAGKVIRRKIYYSEAAFADPDTGTWVEFTPAPADDASFATVKAALLEYLKARTGGTVPISLKQTWEEVTAAPAFTGLLNETYGSGAEAAYSTRRLNGNVTDCMVIRRASDSTTTTIGFDSNGNIDEAAITTFCTGTTCTVETWKDQSGNGNDATQSTPANQPTIYTGGALVKQDGRVGVDFDGSTNALINTTVSVTDYDFSIVNVNVHPATNGIPSGLYLSTSSNTYYQHLAVGGTGTLNNRIQARVGATTGQGFTDAIEGQRNLNYLNFISATSRDITVNGVQSGSNNTNVTFTAPNSFSIGAMNDSSPANYLDAIVQEVILYGATKSSADQTSVEENIGDYFTQNTPLLDTYSGAAAAYSLRLLDSTYTGSAIRVRRSSDNTEQDIGFNVFGELDTVSLLAFAGTGDAFVKTWYDQSGNSNDATQTATGSQPKIVSSGAVIVENGKPAVEFDGSNDILKQSGGILNGLSSYSLFSTFNPLTSATAYEAYLHQAVVTTPFNNTFQLRRDDANDRFNPISGQSLPLQNTTSSINNSQLLVSILRNGATTNKIYQNGTFEKDLTSNSYTIDAGDFAIGGRSSDINFASMKAQEFVIYGNDQTDNRTDIESNINTFYSIY